MEQDKLKRYIKQREQLAKKGDRYLYIFLIIFIIGYVFFFSSSFIFKPVYKGVEVSPIGKIYNVEDRNIILDSWTYDQEKREMEVLLDIENLSLDGNDKYDWKARESGRILKVEKVYEKPNFVALKIKGLSRRWVEVSLSMNGKDENGDEKLILKLYTNDKKIKKVKFIENKTFIEYMEIAKKGKLIGIEDQIKEKNKLLKKKERNLKDIKKIIERLNDKNSKLTDKEQVENISKIEDFNNRKEQIENEIKQTKEDVKEMKERINLIGR